VKLNGNSLGLIGRARILRDVGNRPFVSLGLTPLEKVPFGIRSNQILAGLKIADSIFAEIIGVSEVKAAVV
jgi:hypothetical protein